MILFLNFAPLSFGGGAERWMASVAQSLVDNEGVNVIQVHQSITNAYSQFVLNRKFDKRIDMSKFDFKQTFIRWGSFVPFSKSWKFIRSEILESRHIYTRLELNEIILLLYFGGYSVLKKTIIGLHSPLFYNKKSISILGRLHNVIYNSIAIRKLLGTVYRVHVLNSDQEKIMVNNFKLKNVVQIPNFIDDINRSVTETNKNELHICFIGELDERKGADLLLELIDNSPSNFHFNVVGDGHLKPEFTKLNSKKTNFYGYIDHKKIGNILGKSDILFMPSKAESFSLVSLEALSQGLTVVCSSEISQNSLEKYTVTSKESNSESYLELFEKLSVDKQKGILQAKRKRIADEVNSKYSKHIVTKRLRQELFDL